MGTDTDSTTLIRTVILSGALVALCASPARAQEAALPLPASVEVRDAGVIVRTSPSPRGGRRGTLVLGARLRPLEVRAAAGCGRAWYRIGQEAWVCGEALARRGTPPAAPQLPVVAEGAVVPHRYGFAGPEGARLYRTLENAEWQEWEREFDPGNGLHLRERVARAGRAFWRLVRGGVVPVGDVRPARVSRYVGLELASGQPAAAVIRRPVPVRARPGRGRVVRRLGRRSVVPVLERSRVGRATFLRVGEDEWIRNSRRVSLVEPEGPPPAVAGDSERWIHVDRGRQILTAYSGTQPVYVTQVSTGRRGTTTPRGTFRIWAKLATDTMDDEGEGTIDDQPYEMQGVPWVMYFNEGVALHGAYWHDDFGRQRSHGCVNLAPRDAAFLFGWTSPRLQPGWKVVLPTATDRGTLVVVD